MKILLLTLISNQSQPRNPEPRNPETRNPETGNLETQKPETQKNLMTFNSFEEIEAWQLAREMCKMVSCYVQKTAFSKDFTLIKQMKSSSGSAMDCIAEGHERGNNKEFIFFLGVSLGSCGEVRSQAYRALDEGYISEDEQAMLHGIAKRTSAAIAGLLKYLNHSPHRGLRYKKINRPPSYLPPEFPSSE